MSSLPPENRPVVVWYPGDKLFGDRYTIETELGRGGFGITYLAIDEQGNQLVIKTLNEAAQRSPKFEKYQQDFLYEATRLGSCRHPHIVQIENNFQQEHLPCIVMEYVQGEDLWKRVEDGGPLSETEALLYIKQIAAALTVVHNKGLLHRDVKPGNIMVRFGKAEAVLIDFGIAKEFIPDKTQRHTQAYTDGFSPLEQYDEEGRPGKYTDVYSLSATLYYLLTKELPPPAYVRVSRDSLKPPKDYNPSMSDDVNQAIVMGMALDANKRPQSVEEWLDLFHNPRRILVDYQKLEELLAARKWQEASQETAAIMLKICGREEPGWLHLEDIQKIPCADFRIIDKLWVKYSKGRFGFSVQKRIWEKIGGNPDAGEKTWERFGERVGWYVKLLWILPGSWLGVDEYVEWSFELIELPDLLDLQKLLKWFALQAWRIPANLRAELANIYLTLFNNVIRPILTLKLTLMPKIGHFPKIFKPRTGILIGRGAKVALLNLQQELFELRQFVAQDIANQKRTEKQYMDSQNEANKWQQRAENALQQGDPSLAQQAFEYQQAYINTANSLKAQHERQTLKVNAGKRTVIYQHSKVAMAKQEPNWEMAVLASKLAECNIR